jgi:hypothetical protein
VPQPCRRHERRVYVPRHGLRRGKRRSPGKIRLHGTARSAMAAFPRPARAARSLVRCRQVTQHTLPHHRRRAMGRDLLSTIFWFPAASAAGRNIRTRSIISIGGRKRQKQIPVIDIQDGRELSLSYASTGALLAGRERSPSLFAGSEWIGQQRGRRSLLPGERSGQSPQPPAGRRHTRPCVVEDAPVACFVILRWSVPPTAAPRACLLWDPTPPRALAFNTFPSLRPVEPGQSRPPP